MTRTAREGCTEGKSRGRDTESRRKKGKQSEPKALSENIRAGQKEEGEMGQKLGDRGREDRWREMESETERVSQPQRKRKEQLDREKEEKPTQGAWCPLT